MALKWLADQSHVPWARMFPLPALETEEIFSSTPYAAEIISAFPAYLVFQNAGRFPNLLYFQLISQTVSFGMFVAVNTASYHENHKDHIRQT